LALRYLCRWDQAGMTGDATDVAIDFNNGAAYDRFMGRWSRAVGALFLNWVVPPKHARRLEVGCGTGAFTELVLHTCSPSGIIATDSAVEQIETAQHQLGGERVEFQIANAQMSPFPAGYFDVIASALVLNFISDRKGALQEMLRVGRPGGTVAAYVWDFTAGRAPNSCLALALRRMGIEVPRIPGSDGSTLDALRSSFEEVGFDEVTATPFDIPIGFRDF
jgi:ubiquinone/menaquinone biosynthesis C-methylase UbiE